MVLLAVCNADYSFTLFDYSSYESNNGCGVLLNSLMGRWVKNLRDKHLKHSRRRAFRWMQIHFTSLLFTGGRYFPS